jgi:hypothetical protein
MMDLDSREALLEAIANRRVTLRDFAGLRRGDVESIAHLGAVSFEAKKFEQAAIIFAGLEALEPDRAEHTLNRAHSEVRVGRTDAARAALDRYISRDLAKPVEDIVDALLLRASLLVSSDPARAELDVAAAQQLETEAIDR